MVVRRLTRRLTTFSTGAYSEAGLTIATEKVFVQWNQAPMKCPGVIRDEAGAGLPISVFLIGFV